MNDGAGYRIMLKVYGAMSHLEHLNTGLEAGSLLSCRLLITSSDGKDVPLLRIPPPSIHVPFQEPGIILHPPLKLHPPLLERLQRHHLAPSRPAGKTRQEVKRVLDDPLREDLRRRRPPCERKRRGGFFRRRGLHAC